MLVSLPTRTPAAPICSSKREFASAHSRSPVTTGRFACATARSSSPAGDKVTVPSMCESLATLVGGSAKAAALVKSASTPINPIIPLRHLCCILLMSIPLVVGLSHRSALQSLQNLQSRANPTLDTADERHERPC